MKSGLNIPTEKLLFSEPPSGETIECLSQMLSLNP